MNSNNSVASLFTYGFIVGLGIGIVWLLVNNASKKTPLLMKMEQKVRRLIRDGHYDQSVNTACQFLSDIIRHKSGVNDKDGMQLINLVFKKEQPLLRIKHNDEHPQLTNWQGGLHQIYAGIAALFRNPQSHANLEIGKEEAEAQTQAIIGLAAVIEHCTERVEET